MNLITNSNYSQEQKKNKKIMRIIVVSIVLLTIVCLAILGVIYYLKAQQLKVYIDGKAVKLPENVFILQPETGKVYVNIKRFAPYVQYEYGNGEYKVFSEDTNKCYVQSENETTSYILNSPVIYKKQHNVPSSPYEYFTLRESVTIANKELYTSQEGAEIGFNVDISYDIESNTIKVFTLPYLVNHYTQAMTSKNYTLAATFNEQKAVLKNLIVESNPSGKFGVVNPKGESIISNRYDVIQYLEGNAEFFVTTQEKKVGILSITGETKIQPTYDSLSSLSQEEKLYIAKVGSQYGVIDGTGRIIVHMEYDTIGINKSLFSSDNIDNNAFFYDNCIPVAKDGKWGIYDKTGGIVAPLEYDGLGYAITTQKDKTVNNLLLVPEYEGIVVSKGGFYGLVNSLGKVLVPCGLEEIYSITNNGKNEYYMKYQGQVQNLKNYLKATGQEEVKNEDKNENNTVPDTNTNTTNPETTNSVTEPQQNTQNVQNTQPNINPNTNTPNANTTAQNTTANPNDTANNAVPNGQTVPSNAGTVEENNTDPGQNAMYLNTQVPNTENEGQN